MIPPKPLATDITVTTNMIKMLKSSFRHEYAVRTQPTAAQTHDFSAASVSNG
jgi:hypothetical protein